MAEMQNRAMIFGLCAAMMAMPVFAGQADEIDEGSALPPTLVQSKTDAERLRTLQGVTLQWIGWEERGAVAVTVSDQGHWWLEGSQGREDGASLRLDGFISEIGSDYFLFDGRITINGAPDPDRVCDVHKVWRFEATQRRAYYRLREFEWCDYLTDYVDLYFAPGLR